MNSRSRRALAWAVLSLVWLPRAQGQEKTPRPERFRFERVILPGAAGPNRLRIDVPLLAGTTSPWQLSRETTSDGSEASQLAKEGLSDLRLFDSANREVPFLLVTPPAAEPQWLEARLLPVAATKRNSGFETDLGRSLLSDRARMGGIPAPFLKRVRLEGSGDRGRWTVLVDEGTLFDLPGEKLKRLELEFEPGEYRYFRITWEDSTSARVPLPVSVSARLVSMAVLPPPLRVALQAERRPGEPGVSRYRIRLPGRHLPIVAIEITSTGENILRKARVIEARLQDGEMAPNVLGMATLWHSVRNGAPGAELRIPIRAPQEAQIELTINDESNPPLEFTAVTAVFADLPWIYFEGKGREPLTARYGYPDLAPPRYDLEAMRDSIGRLRTAEARWGDVREKKPEVENRPAVSMPGPGAQIDTRSFRFWRRIPPGRLGLNALLLDAAILSHGTLSDLRIAGPDGRQIPYLVEKLDEPLTLNLPPLERMDAASIARGQPGLTCYRLCLPYENLPGSRLVLTTSARVFRRDLYLLIERNPGNERQEPWTERIAQADWSNTDPETPSPPLTLRLPTLKTADVRLVLEEGDNSALPIETVRLLLPALRLRFFRETEAELTLYYGRSGLEAPRYDLALLTPSLLGEAAEEISFGSETLRESSPGRAQSIQIRLFWGILTVAVVVLLVLIVRLVRKGAAR